MNVTRLYINRVIYALFALPSILLAAPVVGDENSTSPVLTTKQFAFYSNFETNINDALIVAGAARNAETDELFQSEPSLSCFEGLAPSLQAGWNLTVDYYARVISRNSWNDRQQFTLRLDLAGIGPEENDENTERFMQMAAHFRSVAGHAYRTCHWEAEDAINREWIGRLQTKLEQFETLLAERIAPVYETQWHGLPLRVDVVAHAPPVGANSIAASPDGGHILASNTIEDIDALEIIFHESTHTIANAWRGDPLITFLNEAAEKYEVTLPRDLWHVAMFYLTGETVRRTMVEAGDTDYKMYMEAHGLWEGRWGPYREAVEASLLPYLNGEGTLTEATDQLVEMLKPALSTKE